MTFKASEKQEPMKKSPTLLYLYLPERKGDTPVAKQIPSKSLSKTSLSLMTPPPPLVTSIPAAFPPNILL